MDFIKAKCKCVVIKFLPMNNLQMREINFGEDLIMVNKYKEQIFSVQMKITIA